MMQPIDEPVPPEVTAAVGQELHQIHLAIQEEYRGPDGTIRDVIDQPEALDDRLDKLVRRLAERMYGQPRPLALDRCILFLAVVRMPHEAGCLPVLALRARPEAGYRALLAQASQAGEVIAVLTIYSEVQTTAVPPVRVVFADRADTRGTVRRWAKGPLQKDGTTALGEWTAEAPPEARAGMADSPGGLTETLN